MRKFEMKTLFGTALVAVALSLTQALPAAAQETRDSLVMGMVLEPPHLDPTEGAAAAIDEVVYANVFEGLTRIARDGTVQPALAESWEISEDGKTYTFKLRRGVTFHDGSRFDSSDAIFSFEHALAEDSANAQKGLFEPIVDLSAPDAFTLVVKLRRPTGHFLFNLGWGDAVMIAPETWEQNKTNPVGTGPFKFQEWVKGDSVTLTAYENYWGEKPALKTAVFKFIPDPAASVAALLAGDVDAFANLPAPESLAQFESDPRFEVVVGSTEGETILAMNNGRKPFDDVRVRRAMAHAVDRTAVIEGAMYGYGTPIGSHFAPHHPAYVDLTDRYPYDPEAAKALLAEAGYAEGFEVTLKLPPPAYARRGGEIIAAQLAQVGIEAEIIPVEWAQWLEQVFKAKDYDLTIVSHTEPMDIGIYARDDYYFDYHDEEFQDLMVELDAASDPDERIELMQAAQRKLAEDSVNVFLFQLAKHGVWNADLEGLWENSPVQANDLTDVRWTE